MSESSRSLPDQPSLRFLKLEARRRGRPVNSPPCTRHSSPSRASTAFRAGRRSSRSSATASQTRTRPCSIISAGSSPGWRAPASRTGLRPQHKNWPSTSSSHSWTGDPDGRLIKGPVGDSPGPGDCGTRSPSSPSARGRFGPKPVTCGSRPREPTNRRTGCSGCRPYRVGESVTDARVATPPADAAGQVPEAVAAVAEEALGEFGLPGLVLAWR